MRRSLLLLAFLAACSRESTPPGTARYEPADQGFALTMPADWRVAEADGGAHRASFYGPAGGPRPFSDSIAVYHYGPGSSFASPADFAAAKTASSGGAPAREREAGGRKAMELSYAEVLHGPHPPATGRRRARAVLIPDGGGFWAVVHTWPESAAPQDADFEAALASFVPRR